MDQLAISARRAPTFDDFSRAFDELRQARNAWEAFGEARYEKMPPVGVWAAKRAYDDALKQYDAIVAAIVDPGSAKLPIQP
jgi:hypothetical protein